jgi:hypothetical protein
MSTTQRQPGALPAESEMDRDDALEAFVAVVNVCEPDHPYHDAAYPVAPVNVDYGTTRTYHARCGPKANVGGVVVAYNTRMTYINRISRPRHLALLVHEVSHIPNTAHYESGTHPPSFWREMAFNALLVRDSLRESGAIAETFGDVSVENFLAEVVADPNPSTVDHRYMTPDECRDMLADLVGYDRDE